MMRGPFDGSVINLPTGGYVNPMSSMPAEQFNRSIDMQQSVGPVPAGGGTTANFYPPFWLISTSTTTVSVQSGTVNGIVPSNVATNIDVSTANGTWNVWLYLTLTTTGTVSTATVSASTASVPANTSTAAAILDGQVTVSSSVITAVTPTLAWSQTFVACTAGDPATYYWVVA